MFGRFGWTEILLILILVLILFGHNKVPGMMKNLANGINVFKREIKDAPKSDEKKPAAKPAAKKAPAKKSGPKKVVAKKKPTPNKKK